jgi:hypothetical protein
MIRIRHGWLVAALALSGTIGATACKKDDNKDESKPAPMVGDKTSDKALEAKSGDKAADKAPEPAAPAAPLKAITGQTADDLSLLPVDSEAVLGINFGQLQGSALWKQFVAPKLASAGVAGIQKFKALCGFDPLAELKSVAVGMKGLGGNDVSGAIVVHGFDRKKSMACFDKDIGDAEKDGSKVKIDGDVVLITDKSGKKIGFTFVNDDTALAVIGPDAETKDKIKAIAGGGTALKTSAAFVELYNKLATSESLWMVINGNAPMFQKTPMPFKLKAVYGSLNITDGLTVDLRLRLGSADEATNIVSTYKGQLENPQMKGMFQKLQMTSEGADVKVAVAMSSQQLQQLAQMMMGMIGQMGGMGGGGMGGGMGGP